MTAYALKQNLAHEQQALALLTGEYSSDKRTPNVRNMVRSMARRTQEIENVLFAVMASQNLAAGPTGQALNQLGDLLQEARGSFSDVQYAFFLRVIARARASGGRAEDAIQIAALALGNGGASFAEYVPPGYLLTALDIVGDYAYPLASALSLARPPGVLGELEWSDFPATGNIVLQDATGGELEGFTGIPGTPLSMPGLFVPGLVPSPGGGTFVAQGLMDEVSGEYPFRLLGAIQL